MEGLGRLNISVIMLAHNREALVGRAIESILNQTLHDLQFIIIDNGSTDNSGAIADMYASRDSRIQVVHRRKGSIGSGRNEGLKRALGKYVAFIDDDDYAESDFLEFLYSLAEDHSADIAVCGSNKEEDGLISPNGPYAYHEQYILNTEDAVRYFLQRKLYNAAMPTKLVRRELFAKTKFPRAGNFDDITTTYRLFARAQLVAVHGLAKYTFSRHSGNNSSSATKHHLLNPAQLDEYLTAFRERTEYIRRVLPRLADLALYSEWSYMISMIEKINRFRLIPCKEAAERMKSELKMHYREFSSSEYIEAFEKDWLDKFIKCEELITHG